jgi:transposase
VRPGRRWRGEHGSCWLRQPAHNGLIADRLRIGRHTVGKWRERFARLRLDGLYDEPRPGAPRRIGDDEIADTTCSRIAARRSSSRPTRCSSRRCATSSGSISIRRSAPVVLCVDEKSQIQALDRTQPLLAMRPGQAERRTHDYKRHGTLSLFAALDVKAGKVIGRCFRRHRAREFRKFLDTVEHNVPAELAVHIIMDNAGTHKTKLIRNWFAKRPHWHVHFTPTSASWISQVERFFALLTEQQLRRGVYRSTADLEAAIHATSTPIMPSQSPSDGPNLPMTFSPPSTGSAFEPSKPTRRNCCEFPNQDTREWCPALAGTAVEAAYGCRQLRVLDASGMKGEGLPTLFCGGDDLLIAKFQAGVISANLGPVQPACPAQRQPCPPFAIPTPLLFPAIPKNAPCSFPCNTKKCSLLLKPGELPRTH